MPSQARMREIARANRALRIKNARCGVPTRRAVAEALLHVVLTRAPEVVRETLPRLVERGHDDAEAAMVVERLVRNAMPRTDVDTLLRANGYA